MSPSEMADHIRKNRGKYILVISLVLVSMLVYLYYVASRTGSVDNLVIATPVFGSERVPAAGSQSEILATPQLATPIPVSTAAASNQWRVIDNSETVKMNGYVYAVVTFQNVTTMEIQKGQCQQPKWKIPEKDHLYLLVNTFHGPTVDYWLFVPIEGVDDNTYQRFSPIN